MDFAPWLKVKYDFSNGAFKIWGMQSLISFGHKEKLIYAAFELPNFNYNDVQWATHSPIKQEMCIKKHLGELWGGEVNIDTYYNYSFKHQKN